MKKKKFVEIPASKWSSMSVARQIELAQQHGVIAVTHWRRIKLLVKYVPDNPPTPQLGEAVILGD